MLCMATVKERKWGKKWRYTADKPPKMARSAQTRITLVRVANLRKVQNAGKTLKPAKKALKSFRKATVNENAKGKSQTTNAVKSLGNYRSAGSKMPCLPTL